MIAATAARWTRTLPVPSSVWVTRRRPRQRRRSGDGSPRTTRRHGLHPPLEGHGRRTPCRGPAGGSSPRGRAVARAVPAGTADGCPRAADARARAERRRRAALSGDGRRPTRRRHGCRPALRAGAAAAHHRRRTCGGRATRRRGLGLTAAKRRLPCLPSYMCLETRSCTSSPQGLRSRWRACRWCSAPRVRPERRRLG